jgi:UV DNA damage endonuclease
MNLEDCSPSKTVTLTGLSSIPVEKRITRLKKIAQENIQNTLRILRYNKMMGIEVYRISSKIFPLATYPDLEYFHYIEELRPLLRETGRFIKENNMRISSHPDHFVLLNSISDKVYKDSIKDLNYHRDMFEMMGLDEKYKFVLHVGGIYSNKKDSLSRFYKGFNELDSKLKNRIILENDDKCFTAADVLNICQELKIPMVFDVHHYKCNYGGEDIKDILPKIFKTWENEAFVPKVHFSSPKDERNFRNHADYIDEAEFIKFINIAKQFNKDFDVMIEAKKKNDALIKLRTVQNLLPDCSIT